MAERRYPPKRGPESPGVALLRPRRVRCCLRRCCVGVGRQRRSRRSGSTLGAAGSLGHRGRSGAGSIATRLIQKNSCQKKGADGGGYDPRRPLVDDPPSVSIHSVAGVHVAFRVVHRHRSILSVLFSENAPSPRVFLQIAGGRPGKPSAGWDQCQRSLGPPHQLRIRRRPSNSSEHFLRIEPTWSFWATTEIGSNAMPGNGDWQRPASETGLQ